MSVQEDLRRSGKRLINERLREESLIFENLGKLGSFGDVSFRVSRDEVLAPEALNITKGGSYSKFSSIGGADSLQFDKRSLRTISLNIVLFYKLVPILKTLEKLTRITEEGENYPLILGGRPLGIGNFILKNYSENWKKTDGYGTPLSVSLSLNFEEYVKEIKRGEFISDDIQQEETYKESDKVIATINRDVIQNLGVRLW